MSQTRRAYNDLLNIKSHSSKNQKRIVMKSLLYWLAERHSHVSVYRHSKIISKLLRYSNRVPSLEEHINERKIYEGNEYAFLDMDGYPCGRCVWGFVSLRDCCCNRGSTVDDIKSIQGQTINA